MANPLDSEPELLPFVDPETQRLFRDRALSGDDEQWLLAEFRAQLAAWRANLPKPTREQMLQLGSEADRTRARFSDINEQGWQALDANWRRKQKPDSPQWDIPKESPPPSDASPANVEPPTSPEETRKQLEAFHSLVGEPEPPRPQLGALLDSLKKSVSAQSELPPKSRVPEQPKPTQETLNPQGTVAHSPTEFMYKQPPGFVPHSQKPETLADEPQTEAEILAEQKKAQKPKSGGGSLSRWLTVKPLPPSAGRFRSAIRDVVSYLLEFGPLGIIIGFLLAGGAVALYFASMGNPGLYLVAESIFAIAILLFVIRCIYEFRTHENRRMISSIFLALGVIALVLTVGVFEIYRPHSASQSSPKQLHEYFDEEVNNGLHKTLTLNVIINNQTIPVQMRMSLNFPDRAEWLAFYVPSLSEDDTFQVCTELLNGHEGAINLFVQAYQGKIEMGPIGGRMTEVKDLKFTGYIRLYHETSLNQSELDMLTAQAQKKGLSVESRSTYYLLSRMPK